MNRPDTCDRCHREQARAIVTAYHGPLYSRQAMCWQCANAYTRIVLSNHDASHVTTNPIY